MALTANDIDLYEQWWVEKSRVNFLAYRQYMRYPHFKTGWFTEDLSLRLQQFYSNFVAGNRPVLIIQSPPQHGKSWAVADIIQWLAGKISTIRIIFASFSDNLGIRCNTWCQRAFDSFKYKSIFPDFGLSKDNVVTVSNRPKRNSKMIEFWSKDHEGELGYLRNTTILGQVTGESLDIGVIDDAVKGREQANSIVFSQKTWNWFIDDFTDRFSEQAGLIVVMTRWTTHDMVARILDSKAYKGSNVTLINYKALATDKEPHRSAGEPLFPELKSLEFLLNQKSIKTEASWEARYQGNPTVTGGNLFKDDWWEWYTKLPPIKYKFITADTAQKTKNQNDWTIFQCWGMGIDNRIYILDKFREKLEAPELRREAEIFYRKHDLPRQKVDDPILRGMYIEDKSSGTGLLQELRRKRLKVIEVPRVIDKIERGKDASGFIEAGLVVLNTEIPGIDNLTKEGREFPNGEFDDDIDTLMTAVEVAFINKDQASMLKAAMEAD